MNTKSFMVSPGGKGFSLDKRKTDSTQGIKDKQQALQHLQEGTERLKALQDVLYAHDQYGVLLIFQAMDAAGKDGTIKHVMSGINPQGCQVYSFKQPSKEELDHDFMWRVMKSMPERGRIGIFNRSYYEEVLVVRVHPEYLNGQRIPQEYRKNIWSTRFSDINNIEKYLVHNGIIPIKFFLHVSREEQLRRFIKRVDDKTKNWKFSEADVAERKLWDKYMDAYEQMLKKTSTKHAPWYVIPADHKWYTRVVVSRIIAKRLAELPLSYPKVSKTKRERLLAIREQLLKDG